MIVGVSIGGIVDTWPSELVVTAEVGSSLATTVESCPSVPVMIVGASELIFESFVVTVETWPSVPVITIGVDELSSVPVGTKVEI